MNQPEFSLGTRGAPDLLPIPRRSGRR
jgi:hypothetical protein